MNRVVYAGLYYILPLKANYMSVQWFFHVFMAFFIGFSILFNYFSCASTNPGSPETVSQPSKPRSIPTHPHASIARSEQDSAAAAGRSRSMLAWLPKRVTLGRSRKVSIPAALTMMSRREEAAGWTEVLLIGPPRCTSLTTAGLPCQSNPGMPACRSRGWDYNTDTPKAPRSHYDHVSKKLVLNMDHCESSRKHFSVL